MLRWGILGAGSVARRRVMPAINAHPRCQTQALMVRDPDRAAQLATQFGAQSHYHRAEDLIADPTIDAVYVSSPVHLHCQHVLATAAHGKHVFCEKPMALTADECRRMIQACTKADVHLEICFVLRGWPIYHQVKSLLDQGRLGQLIQLRVHLAKWTPRQASEWRLDPKQSGGGILIDAGSHYLDLFRFLAGDLARIACMGSSAVFNWEVEESAFALVQFKSGVHATLSASSTVPHGGNVLEIYGTEGSLLLGKDLRLVTAAGEETWPATFPDYYSGLLDHFCRCIEEGGNPLASGLDGLRNTQAIETAYRSLKQGHILDVPE